MQITALFNLSVNFVLENKKGIEFYEGLTQKQYLFSCLHVACACSALAVMMIPVDREGTKQIKWKPI